MIITDEAKIDKAVELYEEYGSVTTVANKMHTSIATISKYLHKRGIRPKDRYTDKLFEITKMHSEGMKSVDIARELGINQHTVRSILYRAGYAKPRNNQTETVSEEDDTIKPASEVILHTVDDPIYYVKQTPTYERVEYHGKRYADATLEVIGM